MSTNPFRRSSLKGPGGSGHGGGGVHLPTASAPIDIPDTSADVSTPLSVNTKVSSNTQKHVNFASPPAIPISPVSYPSSPEFTRASPEYHDVRPVLPSPTNYSNAIHSDPFSAETEPDEDDGAIEQALENAKANTTIAVPNLEASKQDAVRNTLSRFASAPKRPATTTRDGGNVTHNSNSQRQTMDVDAFKRLLLTGESGSDPRREDLSQAVTAPIPPVSSDASSGTDTASISQRSLFDQGPTSNESPRSSEELETIDAESMRKSMTSNTISEGRKKPPPPAPRHGHGKPVKEDLGTDPTTDSVSSPVSQEPSSTKKPPPPPLARRRSQNSGITRPSTSRKSSSSDVDQPVPQIEGSSKPPPPPRSRRPVSTIERRPSSDLPTTMEESDSVESSIQQNRKSSDAKPAPPPARNSSKRANMAGPNAPPVPPPRRGRGSSRSSLDSSRPPLSAILPSNGLELASEDRVINAGADGQKVFQNSVTNDLMADLAALQREVDEARRKVSR